MSTRSSPTSRSSQARLAATTTTVSSPLCVLLLSNTSMPIHLLLSVHVLAIDPDYRRKGVGLALMQWGIDRADEERVKIYLVPTKKGVPLYTRLGCVNTREEIHVSVRASHVSAYPSPEGSFS